MSGIRRAVSADLNRLLVLGREFCRADGHPFDDERVSSALGGLLADENLGVVWVIEEEVGLTGYAVVTYGYSIESGGRDALLDEIYVRERGTGDGRALMSAILTDLRDRGIPRVFLETEAPNEAARRFYSKFGFETQDSLWMSLDLS